MPSDEHLAVLRRGAAAWNAWRAKHDEAPDLSRAGLRGLDLSGFDLSRADLRGTNCSDTNLAGAHLEGGNLFKAPISRRGPPLQRAFLIPPSWSPPGARARPVALSRRSPLNRGAPASGPGHPDLG
jgi:uncharacterized protein YjbI with pentapeptide repeats